MQIIAEPARYTQKEELYVKLRAAEGRLLTDEQLKLLPDSSSHAGEWTFRAGSLKRLLAYLGRQVRSLNILDIGCGNGWMTHRLYQQGHHLTGIDLNLTELKQAEKVFGSNERLQWVYGDVLQPCPLGKQFDVILFAASCQYFADLDAVTRAVLPLCKAQGSIHLLDSVFYRRKELAAAEKRSEDYYRSLGFPEMSVYYHHHSMEAVEALGYRKQYPPFYRKAPLQWWIR